MPHLVILYTPNVELKVDMTALCRKLAATMVAQRDDAGLPVFPVGGIRVLAYPAAHHAVADGGARGEAQGRGSDYAFVYLNLRMARGRSASVHQRVGQALEACTRDHMAERLAHSLIGITLQVDEGHEVFDAKNSSLHPFFSQP